MTIKLPKKTTLEYKPEAFYDLFCEVAKEAVHALKHHDNQLGYHYSVLDMMNFLDTFERYHKMLKPMKNALDAIYEEHHEGKG